MQIISRDEAIELSLVRYFTGVPCKHGHLAERYVAGKSCIVCLYSRNRILQPGYRARPNHIAKCRIYRGLPAPTREQPELCEIGCGRKARALDHDHMTGKFRGFLCIACNTALGVFGDDESGILRALDYVRRNA